MSKLAQTMSGQCQDGLKVYKEGGKVTAKAHADKAMDTKLIKKLVKPAALTKKACGGMVKK